MDPGPRNDWQPETAAEADGGELEHHPVPHPCGTIWVPNNFLAEPQAAEAARAHVPHSENMCRYRSTRCFNPQARKRNNELHSLCGFHRERANLNQRNLEAKRKREQLQEQREEETHARVESETGEQGNRFGGDDGNQNEGDEARVHDQDDPPGMPQLELPDPLPASHSLSTHPNLDDWETELLLQNTRDSE